MARYDRIVRLDPPQRERAFPGWMTLRDLEGREREPELGRRARLRFMALRPVRRLLARGLDGPSGDSFHRQIEAVREELGQLPARDPERQQLAEYLEEIGGRSPSGVARATLDVGAAAESAGRSYAAEEFYRTALEVAEAHRLDDVRMVALRRLGGIHRDRRQWERAESALQDAAALAELRGDGLAWAEAMDVLASVVDRQGDPEGARRILSEVAERGRGQRDDRMVATAAAGRCALELARGSTEAALSAGWEAVRLLSADDERRNGVLLNLASALRRLGLTDAASSCYLLVGRWAAWPEHRAEAGVEHAIVAAESGDAAGFRERRAALLESLDRSDPRVVALVELGLGRGSFQVRDVDLARDHLRTAISSARDADLEGILVRAEELLSVLEGDRRLDTRGAVTPPTEDGRRIAEQIRSLSRDLVASG